MTTQNQCQFRGCNETIRRNYFLCGEHHDKYKAGLINQCPECWRYKAIEREACLIHALLEELRSLRRNLARTNRVQDFMIFSNDTLESMAAILPMTPEEMLAINGVGPAKLEQYGPDFLSEIRKYAGTSGTQDNRQPSPPPPPTNAVQRDDRNSRSANGGNGHATAVQSAATTQASDPRKRYNAEYRTSDGHYVRSRAEVMIDDWLFNRHIAHAYERKLPVQENALCDFYLPQGNVYIEFWGKEGDPAYARRMREKQEIYKRHNLQLISLTDDELYLLDDRMPSLLRPYGVGVT
jgi:hypothetical protein